MKLDWPNLFVGGVLGTALGLAPAYYFFYRSGKQLEDEAAALKKLNVIMLRGMEEAGWMTLARDAGGNITGMNFNEHLSESVKVSDSVEATVQHPDNGQKKR